MIALINIFKAILNLIYRPMCTKPTENRVLFMSRESNEPTTDYKLLESCINRMYPEYKCIMLCRKIGVGVTGKISYAFHIMRQTKELSRAKIVVLDTYNIPASILRHRDGQIIAQIWHSIGTMKKNSYSILDKEEGRSSAVAHAMNMHKNYDLVFCAGEGYRDYLAESFNYPPEALTICPLPRVDLLRDNEWIETTKSRIYDAHPELKEAIIILYAPTFRIADDEEKAFIRAADELKRAVGKYGNKYRLVIKAHPLSDVESDCPDFETMEMMTVADVFISDYSCSIYEAGVMGIPLYFYTYDYDSYMSRRSVYLDYPNEIPGKMYRDSKSLIEAIDNEEADMDTQQKFISKYVDIFDGSAGMKMTEMIFTAINRGA